MASKKPLKVLYLITKGNWGGAQRYVFDLATAAHDQGDDILVAYGSPGGLESRLSEKHVRTKSIPALARDVSIALEYKAFVAILRLIKKERPDILHLNSSKAGAMGALAGRLLGVPRIIFTAHGWALNEDRPLWQKIPISCIYWVTLILAHTTIAVSQKIKSDAQWMPFTSKKIVVIHNGIAPQEFKTRAEARTVAPGIVPNFWIGIIAELHPIKRINDAIEAMAEVIKKFPNTCLVVMGEGEMRKELEEIIRVRHLEHHVFLLGFVQHASAYLKAFDLVLLPSRSEGLAYALLEAGAAGLPVIASRVGGIPEVIDEGISGVLITPENPEYLAAAITTLRSNEDLRLKYGLALKEKVEKKFSCTKMTTETFAFYRKTS